MSQLIKKILFTTDLSEGARTVFKHTISLSESCNASILMLHIIEDNPSPQKNLVIDLMGRDVYDQLTKENEAYARNVLIGKQREVPILTRTLEELTKKEQSGTPGKVINIENVIVTVGNRVEEIIRHADLNKCDTIVMGYSAHNITSKVMLGGTVRGVMRHWKKPVYLVPIIG